MICTDFTVPNGFRLERLTKTVTPDEAEKILTTKKQLRYTSALRLGETCLLTRDLMICPCCGGRTPAYNRFVKADPCLEERRIPAEKVRVWASGFSLFPEDDLLELQSVLKVSSFTCPRCSVTSTDDSSSSEVRISVNAGNIRLTLMNAYVRDISQYLLLAASRDVRLRLPLRETLVFNVKKGRAVLTVYDSDGHTLSVCDVTVPEKSLRESSVYRLLCRSALARGKLARAFSALLGGGLPFKTAELTTPEHFLSLTQFPGYDRSFFDALPADRSGAVDRSFRSVSRLLHDVRKLPAIYTAAGLPRKKSIRRQFFDHPQLFWFCREAAFFMDLLGDVNYCSAFLEGMTLSSDALVFLHLYPAADVFFRDYAAAKGAKALLQLLTDYDEPDKLQAYAVRYAAAGTAQRRRDRADWQEIRRTIRAGCSALPLPVTVGLRFRDRTVSGYSFIWLKTRADFRREGLALRNCLVSADPERMNVAVIRRNCRTLAAAEVKNERITQAFGPENSALERSGKLWQALRQWACECGFKMDVQDIFDDDFRLPF